MPTDVHNAPRHVSFSRRTQHILYNLAAWFLRSPYSSISDILRHSAIFSHHLQSIDFSFYSAPLPVSLHIIARPILAQFFYVCSARYQPLPTCAIKLSSATPSVAVYTISMPSIHVQHMANAVTRSRRRPSSSVMPAQRTAPAAPKRHIACKALESCQTPGMPVMPTTPSTGGREFTGLINGLFGNPRLEQWTSTYDSIF